MYAYPSSSSSQGLTVLFHGAPGTGKSYAAEAVGYEVGKPLKVRIILDTPRLLHSLPPFFLSLLHSLPLLCLSLFAPPYLPPSLLPSPSFPSFPLSLFLPVLFSSLSLCRWSIVVSY